jgi:lysophospholipase L1-like esterase
MSYWLNKLWEGDTVFEEPVCFSSLDDGSFIGGDLLFTPTEIIKVCSSDAQSIYEENKDFYLRQNKIQRTDYSSLPFLPRSLYCLPYIGENDTAWIRMKGGKHYIKVLPEVTDYQVLVTYRHKGKWNGSVPDNQTAFLPRSLKKLTSKESFKLVFYGDSITAGWEASGYDESVIDMINLEDLHIENHKPPYMPAWAALVTDALKSHYEHNSITKINRGAGGSTASWGSKNAATLVNHHQPDMVILAFGMNNMQDQPEKYKQDILNIITTIRSDNPDCEFLLVSPMIPNPEIAGFMNNKLIHHQEMLYQLQRSLTGIAVAPVHTIFLDLLRMNKHYLDLTGNCINHPNDFSIRIYAQTILSSFGI